MEHRTRGPDTLVCNLAPAPILLRRAAAERAGTSAARAEATGRNAARLTQPRPSDTQIATTNRWLWIGWERSRQSHHTRRMESRSQIQCSLASHDRRATEIRLTPDGRRAIVAAAPATSPWSGGCSLEACLRSWSPHCARPSTPYTTTSFSTGRFLPRVRAVTKLDWLTHAQHGTRSPRAHPSPGSTLSSMVG